MTRGDPFVAWFDELAAIGRIPGGGWHRFAWTQEDAEAMAWFTRVARSLDLEVETDGNGNLWAWWGNPGVGAVVTGSHLDTVAHGGAYDGALGVVSGFAALGELQQTRGAARPPRPLAVVSFADEEGGRFNLPCIGSRLMTGALDPATVLDRTDAGGVTVAAAVEGFGLDPAAMGANPDRVDEIGAFVELHVEQGRGLANTQAAIGIGTAIWPHGRWRVTFTGEANHAGTTGMVERHDPVVALGDLIHITRIQAMRMAVRATLGRVVVEPNSPNSIAGRVTAWLDARALDDERLDAFIDQFSTSAETRAQSLGVDTDVRCESRTPGVDFDPKLMERISETLTAAEIPAVRLPTAAGHDAGILAARVPAAMLFVRNPTGASHAPNESASVEDCLVGVAALRVVLEELAWA